MTRLTTSPIKKRVEDENLDVQVHPGHGIPSQDPDPAAQFALTSEEAQRESKSALTGGGMVAGAAVGATVGAIVGGPVGVVIGAELGAVAGALGGAVAMETPEPQSTTLVHVDKVHLHINDSRGGGRPVVLIHGWPMSSQAWANQILALSNAGYRVVTYDRRGFGDSDKPDSGYEFDTLSDDLQYVLEQCDLQDVTLVGYSMGGGEVARYISRHGESRLHSVVFAAAVTPYLKQTLNNLEGPFTIAKALAMRQALEKDRNAFFDEFTRNFFSVNGVVKVSESELKDAFSLCLQSAQSAALACMDAFIKTDFREDLKMIKTPTLVIHGDADAIVPIEGAGERTHRAVRHSQMVRVRGAPHGLNVSHVQKFNEALLSFLLV